MKRIIAMILVLLVLVPFLASCKDGDAGNTSSSAESKAVSEAAVSQETSKINYDPGLPSVDMNERTFNIYCRWFGYNTETIDFTGEILYMEDDEGNLTGINEQKKNIIDRVQERYNCKIQGNISQEGVAAIRDKVQYAATSGTGDYDMVFESYFYYSGLATSGYLYDLSSFKYVNFDNPWWDQNAKEELSILNTLYFGIGDINTYDNDGTFVVLFNKNLADTLQLPNFYEKVQDNTWTFDEFKKLVKGVSKDLNDGIMDEKDQWGLGTETSNLYLHMIAAGQKIASKDSNDVPLLTLKDETVYSSLLSAVEFLKSGDVLVADDGSWDSKYQDAEKYTKTVINAFIEGRELFYMCGLLHVPYYRSMKDDFGILPIPKYRDTQDDYIHTVSMHTMSCLMVPIGPNTDDNLGIIIEALAAESAQYLTPEYYDKTLKYRSTRDDESQDMLDIIFATRTFDLGALFNWGDAYNECTKLDESVVARIDAIYDTAQSALNETVENVRTNKAALEG